MEHDQDIVHEFPPPSDYQCEDILNAPTPRKIPEEVQQAMERKSRMVAICLAASSSICLALWRVPIVQTMGLYFLPLQYLHWIAGGLFFGSLISLFGFNRKAGIEYFEKGKPTLARIDELSFGPTLIYNGTPTHYAYQAVVAYLDPTDGKQKQVATQTRSLGAGAKTTFDMTYKVGDYVTALFLAEKPKDSIRLMGFLELDPTQGLVKKNRGAETITVKDVAKLVGLAIAIPLFFVVLLWNVIAFGRFQPLSETPSMYIWPFSLGGVVGLVIVIASILHSRKGAKEKDARNQQALAEGKAVEHGSDSVWGQPGVGGWVVKILLAVGGPFLVGGIFFCWAMTLNAWFDTSPEEARIVLVTNRIMVTHNGIFREYKVEYKFEFEDDGRSWLCTPDELAPLNVPVAVARVRKGAFGWPYVARIEAISIDRAAESKAVDAGND